MERISKVKIFYDTNEETLELKINAFLQNSNIEVVDIKFQTINISYWKICCHDLL